MTKRKVSKKEALAELRAKVTPEIVRLEKKYGVVAVSSAFYRLTQIRRKRERLERQARETAAEIAKLR